MSHPISPPTFLRPRLKPHGITPPDFVFHHWASAPGALPTWAAFLPSPYLFLANSTQALGVSSDITSFRKSSLILNTV